MPRRIPDYALQFAEFNMISSIGGFAFGSSSGISSFTLLLKQLKAAKKLQIEFGKGQQVWNLKRYLHLLRITAFNVAPEVK